MQKNVGSDVIFSERRGQSQKPEEIYELIEKLIPDGWFMDYVCVFVYVCLSMCMCIYLYVCVCVVVLVCMCVCCVTRVLCVSPCVCMCV